MLWVSVDVAGACTVIVPDHVEESDDVAHMNARKSTVFCYLRVVRIDRNVSNEHIAFIFRVEE
jgi:hypothetical protein